jgi:hypothetical protein
MKQKTLTIIMAGILKNNIMEINNRKTYKDLISYNNSIFPSDPTGSLDVFNFLGGFFYE